ncbi:hypothetical protein JCM3766R1_000010 [Sporobolomyces carnicolor]
MSATNLEETCLPAHLTLPASQFYTEPVTPQIAHSTSCSEHPSDADQDVPESNADDEALSDDFAEVMPIQGTSTRPKDPFFAPVLAHASPTPVRHSPRKTHTRVAQPIRQIPIPNLPRHGEVYDSENDFFIATYKALVPAYGHGVQLDRRSSYVVTKCGRNNSVYKMSPEGCCAWKVAARFLSDGKVVVDDALSHLLHNHDRSAQLAKNPNYRPTVINPVIRKAFGLKPCNDRSRKKRGSGSALESVPTQTSKKPKCPVEVSPPADAEKPVANPAGQDLASSPPPSSTTFEPKKQECHKPLPPPGLVSDTFAEELGFFLQGTHRSLAPLAPLLYDAGITTRDSLVLFCGLALPAIEKFSNLLRAKNLKTTSPDLIATLELFERSVRDAKHEGFGTSSDKKG